MKTTKNFVLSLLAYFAIMYLAAWGVMILMDDILPKWSYVDFVHTIIAITLVVTAVGMWHDTSEYFRAKADE